jgi:predicted AlkP superfamily phosphohydrolase/phosphomutase
MKLHNKNRVIILGLPGLSINVLENATGVFDTIRKLKDDGTYGVLRSVFPLISPTIWASLVTGTYPNKHGIIEYCVIDSDRKRTFTSRDLRKPPIWELLNAYGLKTGIVYVPFTYPPNPVDGFMLSGYVGSREEIASYPRNLIDLLDKKFRIKELYKNIKWYSPGHELEFVNSITKVMEKEIKVLLYLIENFEWEFLITSFFFIEEIFHYLWKYIYTLHTNQRNIVEIKNKIFNLFKLIDDTVKHIMNTINEGMGILIISPYEIQPLYGTIFLNHVLYNTDLLIFKNSIITMLKRLLYEKISLPERLLRIIYDKFPRTRLKMSDVDICKSIAYSSGWIGQIYINRKLIRNTHLYDNLVDYIILLVKRLNTEKGKIIIKDILKKEKIIPSLEYGPDLYILPKDFKYVAYGCGAAGDDSFADFGPKLQEHIMYPPFNYQSAWHRMNGFIIAWGPLFKSKYKLSRVINVVDVVPTILHIFNIPIPEYVDGNVIMEFLKK